MGNNTQQLNTSTAPGSEPNVASSPTNTPLGVGALSAVTTGTNNTVVGTNAGISNNVQAGNIVAGSNNTVMGVNATTYNDGSNAIVVGFNAYAADRGIVIGYTSKTIAQYSGVIGYNGQINNAGFTGAWLIGNDSTGQCGSVGASNQIAIGSPNSIIKLSNNATGAASAALGANSPATFPAAPYKWIRIVVSDGTTCYIPAWK